MPVITVGGMVKEDATAFEKFITPLLWLKTVSQMLLTRFREQLSILLIELLRTIVQAAF